MTLVKIISGVYGYRPEKSPYVVPVSAGDPAISVEDDEAMRLVNLGVAAYVDAGAVATAVPVVFDSDAIDNSPEREDGENGDPAPGEITATLDPEDLKSWKMDDLKKLAADMGIDVTGIKKKDDLIQAICAEEVSIPNDGIVDGPDLKIEDVIE
jgi:hypothetical protein